MLSSLHLQLADQEHDGTFSKECIALAGMASTAVDYSKTGIAVEMKGCPNNNHFKPDFMSPSPRVVVSEHGYLRLKEEEDQGEEALEDLDAEQRPYRYYESQKALGQLFRAIDERKFLDSMQRKHELTRDIAQITKSVLDRLLEYMKKWSSQYGVGYTHQENFARHIRAAYEENLVDLAYQYSPTAYSPLSEAEVYAGVILGRKEGVNGKPLRELTMGLRERYEMVVDYAITRITKGDRASDLADLYDEREIEGLPRAIACLAVAVDEKGWVDRQMGELKSFGYIAAVTCLVELQRYRITTFGSSCVLPRV